jgi:hypothetical protein
MVCLRWPAAANQAWFTCDERKMFPIADALFLRDEIGLPRMLVCAISKRLTDCASPLLEGFGNSVSDLTLVAARPLAKACKRLQVSGPKRVNVVKGIETINLSQCFRSE